MEPVFHSPLRRAVRGMALSSATRGSLPAWCVRGAGDLISFEGVTPELRRLAGNGGWSRSSNSSGCRRAWKERPARLPLISRSCPFGLRGSRGPLQAQTSLPVFRECRRAAASKAQAQAVAQAAAIPRERNRNFGIIAHVDHGKSTLCDKLPKACKVIPEETPD